MYSKALFFALMASFYGFSQAAEQNGSKYEARIIGGYETSIEHYPYIVYIDFERKKGSHYACGGSIIGDMAILTAAHCFKAGVSTKTYELTEGITVRVRSGSSKFYEGGVVSTGGSFFIHPDYNFYDFQNDAAIIILKTRLFMDKNTQIVRLVETGRRVADSSRINIVGWGRYEKGDHMSDNLRVGTINIVSQRECQTAWGRSGRQIKDTMICGDEPKSNRVSCKGDSGGPVVTTFGVQVGIIAFGHCGRDSNPSVYTSVAAIRPFIETHVPLVPGYQYYFCYGESIN